MVDFIVAGLRASIKHIHNKFGKTPLVGAEVGVFRGQHAQCILNTLNMERLYLIDPWDFFCPWEKNHTAPRWLPGKVGPRVSGEEMYREICQRFSDREDVIIFKGQSLSAVKCIVIKQDLDFVYIDGEHTHKAVLDDLRAWWPRVKKGGVVAGHDYANIPIVRTGVDEFAKEMNIKIQTSYGADFWIDK